MVVRNERNGEPTTMKGEQKEVPAIVEPTSKAKKKIGKTEEVGNPSGDILG